MVITSEIETLRKARRWAKVYNSFDKTWLPDGTLEFVNKVSELGASGIVTVSPRSYAEKLTKYHKIGLPILIAYHDVTRIKPAPDCLIKASTKLEVDLSHCIYVGDKTNDLLTAQNAGAVPLGITWDGSLDSEEAKRVTKYIYTDWDGLYLRIRKLVSKGG